LGIFVEARVFRIGKEDMGARVNEGDFVRLRERLESMTDRLGVNGGLSRIDEVRHEDIFGAIEFQEDMVI